MAQESIEDFIKLARYYAQAEKELEIQHWVHVSLGYSSQDGRRIVLFTYDLPREVYERREWVIEWRKAKLICQHPKAGIQGFVSYYDKRLGNDPKLTSDLRSLISAKAQVTKAQMHIEEYLSYHRKYNLFFDENTDQDLIKARRKLEVKIANVQAAEERMKIKIKEIKQSTRK